MIAAIISPSPIGPVEGTAGVAVGDGVTVAVLVGKGVKVGVLDGRMLIAVRVCAASTVCAMVVSSAPGAVVGTGGGVTNSGEAQPKITKPTINQRVVRRTIRLFITPPSSYLFTEQH